MSLQSSLEDYIREVNNVPLLPHNQELDLMQRSKAGDATARDDLVRANLRLVVNIARSYRKHHLHLPDLIEEGNCALLETVESCQVTKEERFGIQAAARIRLRIERFIRRCL
jgi:RNA polymerase primary sigma factor